MFRAWRPAVGRPQDISAAAEAAAWVAIAGLSAVNPAAGWGSLCYKVSVPVHKFFAGMCLIMVVSGSAFVGLAQLGAAVLSVMRISSEKHTKRPKPPPPPTEEFLHFV